MQTNRMLREHSSFTDHTTMGIVADCCSLLQKLEDKTVHKNMVILYLNMVLSVTVQSACNIGVDSISR